MARPIGRHEVLPANVLSPCTSPMTTRDKAAKARPRTRFPAGRTHKTLKGGHAGPAQRVKTTKSKSKGSAPGFEVPTLLRLIGSREAPDTCSGLQRNLNW